MIGRLSFTSNDVRTSVIKGRYGSEVFPGRYDDNINVSVVKINSSLIEFNSKIKKILDMCNIHPNIAHFYGVEEFKTPDFITLQ